MRCLRPLKAYRGAVRGVSGKRPILFHSRGASVGLPRDLFEVPCGRCDACILERSRQWAVRCMHEAAMHSENCFVTLTYDQAHLPEHGSLVKRDMQLFLKRLRKEFGNGIKFFLCGEYGRERSRPHYHAVLFGVGFPDKVFMCKRGEWPVYTSEVLMRLWTSGISEIGTFSFESASYVARYLVKRKISKEYLSVDAASGECVEIEKEFCCMSRGGRSSRGLGYDWIKQYWKEVYPSDRVLVRGELAMPPRYYDAFLSVEAPELAEQVRHARIRERSTEDDSQERLDVLAKVLESRLSLTRRD